MLDRNRYARRPAAAAVELAVVAPFLVFLFVIAVDWSRIFYYSLTVNNCARNGALYAADPYSTTAQPYANISQAALADAPNLSPQPTVVSSTGADTQGSYVECTVSYTFTTVSNFPGINRTTPIIRTVRVYTVPKVPN